MEPVKRYEVVKNKNLRVNCFCKGHAVATCSSKYNCRCCGKKHHSLLHKEIPPTTRQKNISGNSGNKLSTYSEESSDVVIHIHMNLDSTDHVIIATAVIWVKDAFGQFRPGRALLDPCSQVNFSLRICVYLVETVKILGEIHGIGSVSPDIKYNGTTSI